MTDLQRVAFFRLAHAAHRHAGEGPFDPWRKDQMAVAVPGCTSVSKVGKQKDYEALMLHFAILGEEFDLVAKYAVGQERRLRFVLQAVEADLAFLAGRGVDDAYMVGIYHQAGFPAYNTIDDIPSDALHLLVQISDSYVRKLRKAEHLEPSDLPSSGPPWCIRGVRAAGRSSAPRALHAG